LVILFHPKFSQNINVQQNRNHLGFAVVLANFHKSGNYEKVIF